jgi:hypothetical protein
MVGSPAAVTPEGAQNPAFGIFMPNARQPGIGMRHVFLSIFFTPI